MPALRKSRASARSARGRSRCRPGAAIRPRLHAEPPPPHPGQRIPGTGAKPLDGSTRECGTRDVRGSARAAVLARPSARSARRSNRPRERGPGRQSATRARHRSPARSRARRCRQATRSAGRPRTRSTACARNTAPPPLPPASTPRAPARPALRSVPRRRATAIRPGPAAFRPSPRTGSARRATVAPGGAPAILTGGVRCFGEGALDGPVGGGSR